MSKGSDFYRLILQKKAQIQAIEDMINSGEEIPVELEHKILALKKEVDYYQEHLV